MSTADKPGKGRATNTSREGAGADKRGVPIDTVSPPSGPIETAESAMLDELRATGFIGMWKDREDIQDSTDFVQHLREQIQRRADRGEPPEY
jgi:hypothetical protein